LAVKGKAFVHCQETRAEWGLGGPKGGVKGDHTWFRSGEEACTGRRVAGDVIKVRAMKKYERSKKSKGGKEKKQRGGRGMYEVGKTKRW